LDEPHALTGGEHAFFHVTIFEHFFADQSGNKGSDILNFDVAFTFNIKNLVDVCL
jgi:hypothetical protein